MNLTNGSEVNEMAGKSDLRTVLVNCVKISGDAAILEQNSRPYVRKLRVYLSILCTSMLQVPIPEHSPSHLVTDSVTGCYLVTIRPMLGNIPG